MAEFTAEEKEVIRSTVTDGVSQNFSLFGLGDIIDCLDDLTPEEKQWAKEHLDWKVYEIP